MKYLKLFCDTHHCDTEFLIKVKETDIHEYYTCPACESLVMVEVDEECFVEVTI